MELRGFKTELKPNKTQEVLLRKAVGTSRFAYNWGLFQIEEAHKAGLKFPSAITLHKLLVARKHSDFPWLYEVSKSVPQEALRNLEVAFKNFFRRLKQGQKPGYPNKKRKFVSDKATFSGTIQVSETHVQIPRIGEVRLKEQYYLPEGKYTSAFVSLKAGRWFVSVRAEKEIEKTEKDEDGVGVDLGIKSLAVLSDGTVFENPRPLKRNLRKIKKLQRRVSRKKKGSQNRRKAIARLQRQHLRIANIRKDTLHKLTTFLAKTKPYVVIEDLNVSGMVKNHCLAQAISDVGFFEFKRQLEYKCKWYGSELRQVNRFFPSTKTCSGCGEKQEMPLSLRMFRCSSCGLELDRDLNASINIKVADSSSETENACGELVLGASR